MVSPRGRGDEGTRVRGARMFTRSEAQQEEVNIGRFISDVQGQTEEKGVKHQGL